MVIVFFSSLLVALTWQFAQFVFLLQGFALFALQVMSIVSTSKVEITIHTFVCTYVCTYVCMYVCMYVYIKIPKV